MKKLAILIAATLTLTAFIGCAGNSGASSATPAGDSTAAESTSSEATAPASGETTTLQFWAHNNESWMVSYDGLIEKFNASQSEIVVESSYFPYNDFEAKIQTSMLSGGEGADLYEIWGGWALDFIAADALSPVPEAFMAELVTDCYEPVIGAFRGDDGSTYYGVPLEFNIEYGAMLVNKPKFEEQGLSYPTIWDEMIDIARQTAVANGEAMDMRGLDFTTNDTLTTTFLSMIQSQGGEYLVDGKISLNTPEAIKAMQALVDYVAVDHVTNLDSATGAAGADIDSYHFLARDEAMIVPRGPWVIADLTGVYGLTYGEDFDYIPMPFYSDVKAFPSETGWGLCVPTAAKNTEAAWTFVEFFQEKDNLLQHNVACGQIPPRKTIATDPAFVEAMPFAEPIVQVLEYGKYIGDFNTDVLKNDIKQVYISLCTADGTYATVEDAMVALEAQLNTDLKLG